MADPELRAKLTPDYTIGCKRILIVNDYYPSLTRRFRIDDCRVQARTPVRTRVSA